MAPQRKPSLAAPLQPTSDPAPRGTGSAGPAGPSGAGPRGSGPSGGSGGGRARGGERGEAGGEEDINQLVIGVARSRFNGLDISVSDIDRAHRLLGPNNRVIVRFVRSGPGSVREQLMYRRLELRKTNDLFINESLTAQKSRIQRSLLAAKRAEKLYTVYTRWGHVYYKSEKFGTSTRVDSLEKVRQLGFTVKE